MSTRRLSGFSLIRLIACSASPLLLCPLFEYLMVGPLGSICFFGYGFFAFSFLLLALVTLPISALFLIFRRYRFQALKALLAAGILILSVHLGFYTAGRIRTLTFHRLAERSEPLVRAIKAYETKHGAPPPNLDALVPDFLTRVPSTEMAAYPKYRYYTGADANRFDGNPWVLDIFTPSGLINFDSFLYFPLQNYPETGYGGYLERIRDWAYVHE